MATATAGGYVGAHPADAAINLPPSSWGRYRTDYTWNNAKTAWMWPMIHERERRMESLVARFPEASGDILATLTQAGRELLLLESSDWPFLVTTGQASEYATRRFNAHIKRFDRLTHLLDAGTAESSAGRHLRARLELLDNPFPRPRLSRLPRSRRRQRLSRADQPRRDARHGRDLGPIVGRDAARERLGLGNLVAFRHGAFGATVGSATRRAGRSLHQSRRAWVRIARAER